MKSHHKSDSSSSGGLNMGIIVEARNEYTTQLTNVLKPIVYAGLLSMFEGAIHESNEEDMILYNFQMELREIPKWNSDVIKDETSRVLNDCSYFNELLTAVFLSNVRILTSVKIGGRVNKKFQLVVPTNENFVHQVYINVGQAVYSNPYLFSLKKLNGNITNNINDVFDVIESSVANTIRNMLPIKNILEAYVTETAGEDSGSESESGSESDNEHGNEAERGVASDKSSESSDDNHAEVADDMDDEFPPKSPLAKSTSSPMDSLFEKTDVYDEPLKEITVGGGAYNPHNSPNVNTENAPTTDEHARPSSPTTANMNAKQATTFFDDVSDDRRPQT